MRAIVALLAGLAVLLPAASAQEAQPEAAPLEFTNGQENAFGRIVMEPYVDADGDPVPVEAVITLRDRDLLARTTNLLVAFNLHSDESRVTRAKLTVGEQTLEPVREATVRDGLQHQQFFDPADVLAAAGDGDEVELRLAGLATAEADGQWHIGALVIAFDSVWGTLRASDGGAAELYGFSLLMEHGAGGSFLAPFHGQGNEAILLVPLFVAVLGAVASGWLLVRLARDRYGRHPAGTFGEPLSFAPPAPAGPVPSGPVAVESVVQARPPPQRKPASEAALWSMDFGYRLDPASSSAPLESAPAAPAPAPVAEPTPDAPRLPVQGPKLPPGMTPIPWRPTPLAEPEGEEETARAPKAPAPKAAAASTPKAAAKPTPRRARPAPGKRKVAAPPARQANR